MCLPLSRLAKACIFGLIIYAEGALQKLEAEERLRESAIRKEARIELTRRGMVPTETAIAQWKEERLRALAANNTKDEAQQQQ
jgi:hypothetical protein